jgi:hypothetical protein
MTDLNVRINTVINNIEPEFRIPVIIAMNNSDGTVLGFQQELAALTWEFPELPVSDIFDRVLWDVA